MFIDASAIVAILAREPGYEELEKRLATIEAGILVSPVVLFEASVGLARQKAGTSKPSPELLRKAHEAVEAFVYELAAEQKAITPEIGSLALGASAAYGKAIGHPADLNFGDCFSYGCAKSLGVSLFYKGNDFALTDLA